MTWPPQMRKFNFVRPNFEYNFKGILQVPARALKPKKIFTTSFFILLGLALYDICTYLALIVDGRDIADIFSLYGLFPFRLFSFESLGAILIYYYLGLGFSILTLMLGMAGIAIIDFEDLRGNPFMSLTQGVKFAFSRLKQLLLSELSMAAFIVFIILLAALVGLISRIPVLGDYLYALFFFFPNFIVILLTQVVILVLILSLLITPAATAMDRNGETFNSVLETFFTVTRKPIHWLLYTAYSLITAKICSFIFAYFSFRAVQLLQFSAKIGGGEKIDTLLAAGLNHLPFQSPVVNFVFNLWPGLDFGVDIAQLVQSEGTGGGAGYIMAISLFLIFLIIWGYVLSCLATGQAYALAVIRKIRDGRAVGDEKSLFYEEEYVNPPLDADGNAADEK